MFDYLRALLSQLHSEEEGQTAIEYAAVLVLIALVIAAAMAAGLGTVVTDVIEDIKKAI